jgi:hypothetical protein
VEAAISRLQSPMDVVRLPVEVHDPAVFDVPLGIVLDLRRTGLLGQRAAAGLIGRARRGPLRLLLAPGSQPLEKLRRLFSHCLQADLAEEDGWVLDLCLVR